MQLLLYMKLREVLDILVVPNSFRNVDFSHKGIYTLSFRVHSKAPKPDGTFDVVLAFPLPVGKVATSYDLSMPFTILQTSEYRTKAFYISFNDESIFFDSGCRFRIQVDYDRHPSTQLFLQCFLLHYPITQANLSMASTLRANDFQLRSMRVLKLNTPSRQLDYHGEVIFNGMEFFAVVDLSLIVTRLDYKLRLHNYQMAQYYLLGEEEKKKNGNTQQLFKILPYEEVLMSTQREMGGIPLKSMFQVLISSQLENYQQLKHRLKGLIGEMTEIELLEFRENNDAEKLPNLDALKKYIPGNQSILTTELKKRYQTDNQTELRLLILKQSNEIGKNIKYLWQMIAPVCPATFHRKFTHLKYKDIKEKHSKLLARYVASPSSDRNRQIARHKLEWASMEGVMPVGYKYPMFFTDPVEFRERGEGEVLCVFVHGFQGSNMDLELIKNYIQSYCRDCTCLLINSLEDNTDGNIQRLGEKFAKQVERFIQHSPFDFKRINFLGYSLGGVIIRAGMKHLIQYKQKVNLLITLASPHLGIHRLDNVLVSAGIWYMIKFDKVKSLNELNYSDDDNILMKLSREESLGWFTKIIVASSKEDNFVPNHSARIEPHEKDPFSQEAYRNMMRFVREVVRVDVWFDSEPGAIDKMLGRKAHIEFLESQGFSEVFFALFANQF